LRNDWDYKRIFEWTDNGNIYEIYLNEKSNGDKEMIEYRDGKIVEKMLYTEMTLLQFIKKFLQIRIINL
jgi:hypothetical protein